jgi:hypothetical protein
VNGSEAQRVGNDELAERTPEFGFRGLTYQAQPLSQLHEKMSRALDGVAPPNVDKVLDNHRLVTGRSPQQRRPKTGELSDALHDVRAIHRTNDGIGQGGDGVIGSAEKDAAQSYNVTGYRKEPLSSSNPISCRSRSPSRLRVLVFI